MRYTNIPALVTGNGFTVERHLNVWREDTSAIISGIAIAYDYLLGSPVHLAGHSWRSKTITPGSANSLRVHGAYFFPNMYECSTALTSQKRVIEIHPREAAPQDYRNRPIYLLVADGNDARAYALTVITAYVRKFNLTFQTKIEVTAS